MQWASPHEHRHVSGARWQDIEVVLRIGLLQRDDERLPRVGMHSVVDGLVALQAALDRRLGQALAERDVFLADRPGAQAPTLGVQRGSDRRIRQSSWRATGARDTVTFLPQG